MNNQRTLILTPMAKELEQAGLAIANLKGGMGTYPVSEYVLQSLFLKMTGLHEQKLKCICWELATDDYGYRYRRLLSGSLGECSKYSDKKLVLQDLIAAIKKIDKKFSVEQFSVSELDVSRVFTVVDAFYKNTSHVGWLSRDYKDFESFACSGSYGGSCLKIMTEDSYFGECKSCVNKRGCPVPKSIIRNVNLPTLFNSLVYLHRNRCAHNLLSYHYRNQRLSDLYDQKGIDNNYLIRFALILMIDEVVRKLFEKWASVMLY